MSQITITFAPEKKQFEAWEKLTADNKVNEILYGGGSRGGKEQPLDAFICTPYGFRRMGDMKVGSKVCNPDGGNATVIGVYPQGKKPVYRFTFADGSQCEAGENHLWNYRKLSNPWEKSQQQWKVGTTNMLRTLLRDGHSVAVPLPEPVQFTKNYKYNMRPVEPYLLGVLLGDGCFRGKGVSITNPEQEIATRALEKNGIHYSHDGDITYSIIGTSLIELRASLDLLGLTKKYSHEKHIPESYLHGTIEDRFSLLQGLMDTDGYVDERGHCVYTTTSKQLAEDFVFLSRSLGFLASSHKKEGNFYYNSDREKILCRDSYNISVSGKYLDRAVSLTKKKERIRPFNAGRGEHAKKITAIEYMGEKEMQCIMVDHVNSLYITNDFTVTHNTWLGCCWIIISCLKYPGSAWMIGRAELKRIKQTTLRTFFKVCQEFNIQLEDHYKYNAQQETITFYNGSVVFLADLGDRPSDPEFDRLGSYDLTGVFIDEAQEVSVKAVNVLRGRFSLLEGVGWSTIPKALYTCNPAKNWIYMDFYKPWKEGTLHSERAFIPALVTDNLKYVKQEYIENLKKADKVTVERLLYGNFEYDDDPSVLIGYDALCDMFTLHTTPDDTRRYVSVDVARYGDDRTVVTVWDNLQCTDIRTYTKRNTQEVVRILEQLEQDLCIPRSHFIVDEDGVGGGVVDHFRGCKGFVNNSSALQPVGAQYDQTKKQNYANLKTQCAFLLADYVNAGKIGVDPVPAHVRDQLIEEMEQIKQLHADKEGKIRIVPKDIIKERLGRSPDLSDCFVMRMYFELHKNIKNTVIKRASPQVVFNRVTGEIIRR